VIGPRLAELGLNKFTLCSSTEARMAPGVPVLACYGHHKMLWSILSYRELGPALDYQGESVQRLASN
jgi:hypothetical protein